MVDEVNEEVARSIADTLWTVQPDGSLRAIFENGEAPIVATLVGQALGTSDPIRLTLARSDRVLHASEHADLSAAMDAVEQAVHGEWDEDDRLRDEMQWVAVADAAEDEQDAAARALRAG